MNTGDMVIATWPDGLEIEGKYVVYERLPHHCEWQPARARCVWTGDKTREEECRK